MILNPDLLSWKTSKRSSTMGSHLTVAPYMAALIAEILRSFLSVVAPSFVPLAGQSIPTTGLPLCLLN